MKTNLSIVAIAITMLFFVPALMAQQVAYPPYYGQGQPAAHPQMALLRAEDAPPPMPPAPSPRDSLVTGFSSCQSPSACGSVGSSCASGGACSTGAACATGSSCSTSPACSSCFRDPCSCQPKLRVFAEVLYMRPRDSEVAYSVPSNGPVGPPTVPPPPAIQVGSVAVADFDFDPGFRFGVSGALDDCGRLQTSYTFFETATEHAADIAPPFIMQSLVAHPGTFSAYTPFLSTQAAYSMDFDLIDLDYYRTISCGRRHQISLLFGARYAGLNQDFTAHHTVLGTEAVDSRINFEGGGIRAGFEAEWYSADRCWLIYGRGAASFVGGEFDTDFTQHDNLGGVVVDTDWSAGRIVTMLDFEVGAGWTSRNDMLRLSAGYLVSSWQNTVNTDTWIGAVQSNNFTDLNDSMTFDGLVGRAEIRF